MGWRTRICSGAAILAVGACSVSADLESAKAAVAEYRALLKTGNGAAPYAAADESFRDASSIETTKQLTALYERLEDVCDPAPREPVGWNVNHSPSGSFVTLSYLRTCKTGQLSETYTLKRSGDVVRVAGFNVNGPPVLALLAPAPAETAAAQETPAPELPVQPSN